MKILKFKKINSTQKKAKLLAQKGDKPWTVILAEEQTAGVGRKGDFWYSPRGGLYFSLILPKTKITNLEILNVLAAFSVARLLKESFKLEPFIKLPNDVWVNGKKICGIITENVVFGNEIKCSVMGIGLNTNIDKFPDNLKNSATSIKIETQKKVENKKILIKTVEELKKLFEIISR